MNGTDVHMPSYSTAACFKAQILLIGLGFIRVELGLI